MNLLQMKYAIVIAEKRSINRAADVLFVGQSALSRAVKELESSLGVTLFERSAKGMVPTAEGEIFIRHAKEILQRVDTLEAAFLKESLRCSRFSVSVPRQAYPAQAFASFSQALAPQEQMLLEYCETDTAKTVQNILGNTCKLGLIEYPKRYAKYFEAFAAEKNLFMEPIASFVPVAVFSAQAPLADAQKLTRQQLLPYSEVCFSPSDAAALPWMAHKEQQGLGAAGKITVSDRAGLYALLCKNTSAYHLCAPMGQGLLQCLGLIQKTVFGEEDAYLHAMIYRREYHPTELDRAFLRALQGAWEATISAQAKRG